MDNWRKDQFPNKPASIWGTLPEKLHCIGGIVVLSLIYLTPVPASPVKLLSKVRVISSYPVNTFLLIYLLLQHRCFPYLLETPLAFIIPNLPASSLMSMIFPLQFILELLFFCFLFECCYPLNFCSCLTFLSVPTLLAFLQTLRALIHSFSIKNSQIFGSSLSSECLTCMLNLLK